MKNTGAAGSAREHKAKRLLESEGWAVTRGAGSHGQADLWAAKQEVRPLAAVNVNLPFRTDAYLTTLRLIQVKGNTGSPYKNFSPSERLELSSLAKQTGGTAELWHWPPRGELKVYLEPAWPSVREP